ncbi:hypothetical protein JHK85_018455 [Glycine max]|nr:hypothetical protein JHK85_018455 [Glycine max]KAG5037216.1 hypothetical protein JHK86_018056 [Glycine max]
MSSIPPSNPKEDNPFGSDLNDPLLNPSSPYFIHPSDGLSSVSITPVLDGTNYQSWSRTIRMTLISKNKMAFLLGTILVPSVKEPLYSVWERCNTVIISWLLNSLSPSMLDQVASK